MREWFLTLEEYPDAEDFIDAPAAGVDGELSGHDGMEALRQWDEPVVQQLVARKASRQVPLPYGNPPRRSLRGRALLRRFDAAPVAPTRCVRRMVALAWSVGGVIQ
jgi:hypothetical protein